MIEEASAFELTIAGRKVDGRTVEARRFRAIGSDLLKQLARGPSAAEYLLITNAATTAMLCEQATADILDGKPVDQENYRRNVAMLGSCSSSSAWLRNPATLPSAAAHPPTTSGPHSSNPMRVEPSGRPLFIVDCDDVILDLAVPLSAWFREVHGISAPANGRTARRLRDGAVVPPAELDRLFDMFATHELHRQTLIPGAKEALERFAAEGDVVILTNLPPRYHAGRVAQLAADGMHYPVQCNVGMKGPAVAELVARYRPCRTVFVDDDARHHASVGRLDPACLELRWQLGNARTQQKAILRILPA